jgi:hypothetical protein
MINEPIESTDLTQDFLTTPLTRDTFEVESQEGFELLAQITVVEPTRGDYGDQVHFKLRQLGWHVGEEFVAASPDKPEREHWASLSMTAPDPHTGRRKISTRSKLGKMMRAFMDVTGPASGPADLVGRICWVKFTTISYGKNKDTGEEMKAEDVPLAIAAPTGSELAAVAHLLGPGGTVAPRAEPTTTNGTVSAPAGYSFTPTTEEIVTLVQFYAGKRKADAQLQSMGSKLLPQPLRDAVLDDRAYHFLTEKGYLAADENGILGPNAVTSVEEVG